MTWHKSPLWWLRGIMFGAVIVCLPCPLFAAIHEGEICILKQPDGSYVPVRVWGDEFYQRVESLDGYTLIPDPQTRWICYAHLAPDASEFIPTEVIYRGLPVEEGLTLAARVQILSIPKHQKLNPQAIRQKVNQARWALNDAASQNPFMTITQGEIQAAGELTGAVLGLTLLIEFPDESNTIPRAEIQNYTNQPGYSNYGNNGSVRDYFYDVSNGLLTYTNYVAEYYTAQHNKDYYTDPAIPYGTRARELITEALIALDNRGFDFSILSTDAFDRIRAINAFYAGSRDNAWAQGLWPHKSTLSPTFFADGVRSGSYQITNIGASLSLSTFCHENGHMLFGWPDLYDYDHDSNGIGRFGIMCSSGSSTNPIPPCAYNRMKAGWETIIELNAIPSGTRLYLQSNSFTTYRYDHPTNYKEYFLIESRLKNDRNTYLADEGLIIWHVDEDGSNDYQQMTPSLHYKVSVEQADGLFHLENDINNGGAHDLYHAGNVDFFNDYTLPDARWWSGEKSGLTINQISPLDATMYFTLGSLAAHWKLDEALGATAYDSAGGNRHGLLKNGPLWTAAPNPYQQSSDPNGIVSIEAENFILNTPRGMHTWEFISWPGGFSDRAALRAEPDIGAFNDTGYLTGSPRLDFLIDFVKTGTHYLWIRGYKTGASDDTCHAGLDGAAVSTADHIYLTGANNQWLWTNDTIDGPPATIEISQPGIKTLNLWMREDGFRLDKIILTTDPTLVPVAAGPPENPLIILDPNTQAIYGGALQFDGIDDYVEIDNYLGVVAQQSRTVTAWIKTDTVGDIVTWGNNLPSQKWRFQVQQSFGITGAIGLDINAGYIVGSTDVRDGLWHHVAAVLNDDDSPDVSEIQLYVDGKPESVSAVSPYPIDTISDTNVKIGAYLDGADPNYFKGLIDDVRIYGIALSQPEIAQLAVKMRPADHPHPDYLVPGLEYEYYSGTWTQLPNFDALYPDVISTVSNFDLSPGYWQDSFGFRYRGYLDIAEKGTYTFYLNSDDGSQLYLGNSLIVDNDGIHQVLETSGAAMLDVGKHAITVLYFDRSQADVLEVSYQGPGLAKMLIPDSVLSHIEGLVTHWKLDETEGIFAAGTPDQGYPGILRRGPQWQPNLGIIDGALSLDGIDDYVEIKDFKGITGTHSRTVTAWINTQNTGQIISWGNNTTAAKWLLSVQDAVGTAGALGIDIAGGYLVGDTDLRDGAWHHVAVVLNSDGNPNVDELKLYVDGQPENISAVQSLNIHTATGADVMIGKYHINSVPFSGLLDDVRIYNLPLNPDDIAQLFYQGRPCGAIPADWTGPLGVPDCYVNMLELTDFFNHWLACNDPAEPRCNPALTLPMDLTGPAGIPDGYINIYDYTLLASYWLQCNHPDNPNCTWTGQN